MWRTRGRVSWLSLVLLAGLGALAGGFFTLFTTDNSVGGIVLLTLALALLVLAFFGERVQIESFEILGTKIKVRELVNNRLQLAHMGSTQTDDRNATAMHKQALALQSLGRLYDLYEYIRRTERVLDRRTSALDHLAHQMQLAGGEADFDPVEVSTWFHQGNDAMRVVALNLMLGREECRDFLAVLRTIDQPRSLFEQYYGLRLAEQMLPHLDAVERRVLAQAVGRARQKRRFRHDRPLMSLSNTILSELNR